MARRKCPVCKVGEVFRSDIRTCSVHCSKVWKTLRPERCRQLIDEAAIEMKEERLTELAAIEERISKGLTR